MIILFGSYARGEAVGRDMHVEEGITYEYKSDYDMLVIVASHRNHFRHEELKTELGVAVQKHGGISSPVSFIVHDINFVNHALTHASYFFCDIYKEGIELYNGKNIQLSEPKVLSPQELYKLAKEDFAYWFDIANEFMTDAEHAIDRQSYRKSLFELHQCVENLYATILLVYTHYKPKLHDLEKLRELVNNLDVRFASNAFPNITAEELRLFALLCCGYLNARYKKSFKVDGEDLLIIHASVRKFVGLTEVCCKERLLQLEQKAMAASRQQ
ncbi:MAG: HEPN domain-containing protein [Gammaproteobacteria bacterium]|nr:HEPN domain-containing protein [Gammaproteobacteria bacterium]